jgi:hypothetical protein
MAAAAQAPSDNVSQLMAMYNQANTSSSGASASPATQQAPISSAASAGGDNVSQLMAMYKQANPNAQQQQQSQQISPADANFLGGVPAALGSYAGSAIRGAAQGIANLGTGAINLQERLYAPLFGKPVPAPMSVNLDQNDPNPLTSEAGNLASSFIPGMPEVSGAEEAARLVGNVAPKIGSFLSKAAPAINTAATGAGYGAVYGSANGNTPTAGSIAASAALPLGLQGAIKAPAAGIEFGLQKLAARSANPGSPLLTPQDAAQRLSLIGENNPVSFGTFINSKPLEKTYQSTMASAPFSGVMPKLENSVAATDTQADSINKMLLGNTAPSDVNTNIAAEIKSNFSTNKNTASNMYEDAIKTADSNNFNLVSTPNVNAYLQKEQLDNTIPSGLESLAESYSNGNAFKRDSNNIVSLRQAQSQISSLGTQAASIASNPKEDQTKARWLYGLQNALDNDIQVNLQGSPAQAKYLQARAYFANNVAPYKSPQIYPIAKGYVDNPQNLSGVLAKNQTPQIRTVAQQLSPQGKNLVLKDLFDNADSKDEQGKQITNASKLSNAYSNLSQNATDLLASPDVQNEFNKLKALKSVSDSARLAINPPYTGGRLENMLKSLGWLGAGAYAGLKSTGAVIPTITGALGANRGVARFMESPQLKQAYINQSLPRITNPNSIAGKAVNGLGALADPRLIANAIGQFNQQ